MDTIGQERYKDLSKLFFKESKIEILVYDKSNQISFKELDFFYNELKNNLGDEIILAIIDNKEDLEINDKDVNEDEAREFSSKLKAKFTMASSKFENFLKELLSYFFNFKLIDYINNNGEIKTKEKIKLKKENTWSTVKN